MEAARTLAAMAKAGTRPRRTVVFATWDAEEWGLLGSTEFVEQDTLRLAAHEQLAQNEPDLDGLAEADLVREEVRARIALDRSPRRGDLVGPRRHTGRCEADLSASVETRRNRYELQLRILRRRPTRRCSAAAAR